MSNCVPSTELLDQLFRGVYIIGDPVRPKVDELAIADYVGILAATLVSRNSNHVRPNYANLELYYLIKHMLKG